MQPKKDSRIDSVLRKALAGRVTKGSGDCPDENIVTMYLESRLDPAQRAHYEGHASSCLQCRQVLALAMKLAAGDENEPSAAVSAGHAHLSLRFWLPVSAVAIVVLAIGVLVFQQMRGPRKDAEIAEYRTSASREAQPAVDPAARTEDLSPAVSELRQDASSIRGKQEGSSGVEAFDRHRRPGGETPRPTGVPEAAIPEGLVRRTARGCCAHG